MNISKLKCNQSKNIASDIIAFGLGVMISSFCPTGLLFFIVAAVLVVLGFMLKF